MAESLESLFRRRLNQPFGVQEFPNDQEGEKQWWGAECERRRLRLASFLSIADEKVREQAIAVEVKLCRADPVHWINNWAWFEDPKQRDPARREVPAVLWPEQVRLVRFLLDRVRLQEPALVIKSRENGVSWICMFIVYWMASNETSFKSKLGSAKEEKVDDGSTDSLFGKLKFVHGRQPSFLMRQLYFRYMHASNKQAGVDISGESTNPGFARGGRRLIGVLDEFAQILPATVQYQVWRSCESVFTSLWAVSTSTGPGNKFAELYRELPSRCIFEMGWRADPRRPEDFEQRKCFPLGSMTKDEFDQEYGAKIVTLSIGKVWNCAKNLCEFHDESPEWVKLFAGGKKDPWKLPLLCAWDFGSGPSLLSCLFALLEMGPRSRLWVTHELTWQQTGWRTAAADVARLTKENFKGTVIHYGDPAGRQRDSDQTSWETNLRRGGLPIFCLPDEYSTQSEMEWCIKRAQAMMDDGLLKVHRRCSYLWSCLDNWARNLPAGLSPDFISRTYIAPRKDVYSHGGNALQYLMAGANLTIQSAHLEAEGRRGYENDLPQSLAGSISGALSGRFGSPDEDAFDSLSEFPMR